MASMFSSPLAKLPVEPMSGGGGGDEERHSTGAIILAGINAPTAASLNQNQIVHIYSVARMDKKKTMQTAFS